MNPCLISSPLLRFLWDVSQCPFRIQGGLLCWAIILQFMTSPSNHRVPLTSTVRFLQLWLGRQSTGPLSLLKPVSLFLSVSLYFQKAVPTPQSLCSPSREILLLLSQLPVDKSCPAGSPRLQPSHCFKVLSFECEVFMSLTLHCPWSGRDVTPTLIVYG